ncbi:hypothetical protein [Halococcus hamelinensis]|uniref:Uncharacterized protein n=1 Tax=Halococcus hamelinensis 100A6 TaxID=1132509 RepID=M0MCC2_9EURY|nr:hypothetical protein [Halococcus hamelinensis]EMA42015.1 hypothetical protein C447_00455 [Halococcus hamelinensis 100A6]
MEQNAGRFSPSIEYGLVIVFALMGVAVVGSGALGFYLGITALSNYVLVTAGLVMVGTTAFEIVTGDPGRYTGTNGWIIALVVMAMVSLAAIALQFL